jgi:hypothetical protein
MMRKIIQILLIVSLLGGAAMQSLACVSTMEDSHACCRALATLKKPTHTHSAKKAQPATFRGGSCGCTSAPETPRERPVSSNSPQQNESVLVNNDRSIADFSCRNAFEPPVILCIPNDTSPPPFILYHSLLI